MRFFRRSSPEQPPENASFVPLDEIWPEIEALNEKLKAAGEEFPFPGGRAIWSFDVEDRDIEGQPCLQHVTIGYEASNPLYFQFNVMDDGLASALDFLEEPDVTKTDQWIFKVYEADLDRARQGAILKAGILNGRGARRLPDSPLELPNHQDAEKLVELFVGYSAELTGRDC